MMKLTGICIHGGCKLERGSLDNDFVACEIPDRHKDATRSLSPALHVEEKLIVQYSIYVFIEPVRACAFSSFVVITSK